MAMYLICLKKSEAIARVLKSVYRPANLIAFLIILTPLLMQIMPETRLLGETLRA
jgi:hypothetical protein